jgi:hypothetical protein
MRLQKLYKNQSVHNIISHPLAEIVYLMLIIFHKPLANIAWQKIHDFTKV